MIGCMETVSSCARGGFGLVSGILDIFHGGGGQRLEQAAWGSGGVPIPRGA